MADAAACRFLRSPSGYHAHLRIGYEGFMRAWLHALNRYFPIRYLVWLICAIGFLLCAFVWVAFGQAGFAALVFGVLVGVGVRDSLQTKRAVLRNYPVIGHLRFLLEFIGPEIRQYFIESDNEAHPFSRQQRSLVYQRAKGDPDKRPFGTQLDVGAQGYEWINHSLMPTHVQSHDFRVLVGEGRAQPYSASVFNISAMSFGALSANAILALNGGARRGGFAHDTGEGSISVHHRVHGGDLIWEVGSGYFGCRHDDGNFHAERFAANACDPQVKMIEIKLSQGAKPGHGGVLPGPKVTAEIAAARGVPIHVDCLSPARHSAFGTPIEMMQFIDRLRDLSGGKPTGFKFCVGHPWEWLALCKAMLETGITGGPRTPEPDPRHAHRAPWRRARGAPAGQPAAVRAAGRIARCDARRGALAARGVLDVLAARPGAHVRALRRLSAHRRPIAGPTVLRLKGCFACRAAQQLVTYTVDGRGANHELHRSRRPRTRVGTAVAQRAGVGRPARGGGRGARGIGAATGGIARRRR
jgi:hypothetical protein